jgi:hypothetical protein
MLPHFIHTEAYKKGVEYARNHAYDGISQEELEELPYQARDNNPFSRIREKADFLSGVTNEVSNIIEERFYQE